MSDSTYQVIDSGDGRKLEQVGPYRFVRPAAGAVWSPKLSEQEWRKCDARFERFSGGDGKWHVYNRKMQESWSIQVGSLKFKMQRTDFGHLGIFAEQAKNWRQIEELISSSRVKDFKVLNLFAYTGGSTLASAVGGAKVTHVDASKTSVGWARENAELNRSQGFPIRWIVDDVQKFVSRELRRGSKYHGIILDPPTYGRGTKNEVWKIEQHTMPLLRELVQILEDDAQFVLLSAHSQGYTPCALQNMLEQVLPWKARYDSSEMILPHGETSFSLPSGASSFAVRNS